MAEISELRRQLSDNEVGLTGLQNKLRNCENAYNSLQQFKGLVQTAQENFDTANSGKLQKAADLDSLKERCECAKGYIEGTNRTLNGIGSKVIGVAYTGLEASIIAKLATYRTKILYYETQINVTQNAIRTLRGAIDEAQRALDAIDG